MFKAFKCSAMMAGCLVTLVAFVPTANIYAGTAPPRSIHSKFEPVEMPKVPGPVSLKLAFIPKTWKNELEKEDYYSKEAEISVMAIDNLQYFGDTVWTVKVDSGVWSEMVINVIIPPNDISGIRLRIKWGRTPNDVAAYFVTTGDTIEFYKGRPSVHDPTPPRRSLKTFIDTLTEEQLQTKYEVIVELKKSSQLKFVENFVGSLKDSTLYDSNRKYYKLWITLENLIKIGEEGIESDFVTPPPWGKKSIQTEDSLPKNKYKKDTSVRPGPSKEGVPKWELQRAPQSESEKQAVIQWELRRMHELEKTPHEGEYRHFFKVGEEFWVREPGEYKFHKSVPIKDFDAWIRKSNDSIANIPPEALHEAEMYLDDPKNYELAKQKVDSLK